MKLFYLLLAMAAIIVPIQAVQYLVTNNATGTPGGTRFEHEIEFIWQTLQQDENHRPNYNQITTIVYSFTQSPARTIFDTIYVSSDYIENYSGDVRIEVIGILYHETTRVRQWYGYGDTPQGWVGADALDDGYEITAYFLEYCNGLKDGFVAALNAILENSTYSDDFFVELLGKSVDDLWNDYKSQYGS
ncbi:hypothetical protein ACOSQ4_005237 [Xanthoceras sorbifolium]